MKQVACFLLLFSLSYAGGPGDTVFSAAQLHTFVFHFDYPDYLDSLYQSNADGNFIMGHVTINGAEYDSVGVRFKGTSSFNNYPGHKKSFRLKLHEYKDSEWDGLKRVNLNNGWSDPTMLREKLYLDFLYSQDITAPRANFAEVYIDSLYWGLYTMVEQVDKTFLSHRFSNNNGNLYKAEGRSYLDWRGSDQQNYYNYYDLKTNEKENNQADLVELLNFINNSSAADFTSDLENVFNVESFIQAWAANNFIINIDSYFGSANNFYLYKNEDTGQFDWIIWDVNLAFGARTNSDSLDIFWRGSPRPLIQRLLAEPQYRELYIQSIKKIEGAFEENMMINQIDSLFTLIKSNYFADTLKMYSNEQAQENLVKTIDRNPGLKNFISNRKQNVSSQLLALISTIDENEPKVISHQLKQNYPNPFNNTTSISYTLQAPQQVNLSVYNMAGQFLLNLVDSEQAAGHYNIRFDAGTLASGIYVYLLKTGSGFVSKRKMILIK